MQISRISQNNFVASPAKTQREYNPQQSNVNFTGAMPTSKIFKPISSVYNKLVDGIAVGYGKLLDKNITQKIIAKSANSHVVNHLAAAIGIVVSSTYISSTLKNKQMDPEQRTTLAINQGIVSVVATTMGYTVSNALGKTVDKFVRKYEAVNYKNPNIKGLKSGANIAASLAIFSLMYRYVSPVLVTPIANAIGNKVQANKKTANCNCPAPVQSPTAEVKSDKVEKKSA